MPVNPIYLDYQSTTPCDPLVIEAMLPYFSGTFANPSNTDHVLGREAARAVELARINVAKLINASPSEIIFTSSTTESNHLALLAYARLNQSKGRHIISAKTEHKSTLEPLKLLADEGFEISWLEVDRQGNINLDQLQSNIRKDTLLVTLMHANNEIGTIHPIEDISKITSAADVYFHTDAAQSVGRKSIDVAKNKISAVSLSSHKIYGPKGISALYLASNSKVRLSPWLMGGGQEKGLRSSTLNVPGIVGMGKAYELALNDFATYEATLLKLKESFKRVIIEKISSARFNGDPMHAISHNLSITVPKIGLAKVFLKSMDELCISVGSSCSASSNEPSHVLTNIGLTEEEALSTFRVSFGKFLSVEDVMRAAEIFSNKILARQNRSV